jgi:hypothetical protein
MSDRRQPGRLSALLWGSLREVFQFFFLKIVGKNL